VLITSLRQDHLALPRTPGIFRRVSFAYTSSLPRLVRRARTLDPICVPRNTRIPRSSSPSYQHLYGILFPFGCNGKSTVHAGTNDIQGRIITQIYAEKSLPSRQADRLAKLSKSLDDWKKIMPVEIGFDPFNQEASVPPPHVLSLQYVSTSAQADVVVWSTIRW
jgi:hypothetical protein